MSNLIDPFSEIMNRLPTLANNGKMQPYMPPMDVYETGNAVMIEAPLAGVDPEDVEVSVEDGILTVQGHAKKEHEVEEKNYYRKEVRSGSFYRQIVLPAAVKEEEVSAEFESGVLKITAPKKEEQKEVKKIKVEVKKK